MPSSPAAAFLPSVAVVPLRRGGRRLTAVAALAGACLAGAVALSPAPVAAQMTVVPVETPATVDARLDALMTALQLPEVIAIMRAEGLEHARTLQSDLLGGRGGAGWDRSAARIYDADRMERAVAERTAAALRADPDAVVQALEFFDSPRGQRIIELENSARRAMLDPDVEAAARAQADALIDEDGTALALLRRFIDANDLVESNVEGGLNANFAFYVGLRDSGVPAFDLHEREMLADVWSQEATLRADTEAWLLAYLGMAYRPLPEADLEAYIAFSETAEGTALNRALFSAFNALFVDVSRELGLAAGLVLLEQDL